MKLLRCAWSPVLVWVIACGGKSTQPSDTFGGAGSSGKGPMPQAQAGRDGTAGSPAEGGSSLGGSATGGANASAGSGGSAASASGGTGGQESIGGSASGSAGKGGGGEGGSGAGGQSNMYPTPEALIPIGQAFCAAARSCCMKDGIIPALDDCEHNYGFEPTCQALVRGTVIIDSDGLARCLAAYKAAAVGCETGGVIVACRGLVHGLLREGQSCKFNEECSGDGTMVCSAANQSSEGICKRVVHGKPGEACTFDCPGHGCAQVSYPVADAPATGCFVVDGTYCDRSGASPQCQPVRPIGAACTDSDQCRSTVAECDAETRKCKYLPCTSEISCEVGRFSAGGTCGGRSYGP